MARPSPWGTFTSYSLPAFLAHSEMGQRRPTCFRIVCLLPPSAAWGAIVAGAFRASPIGRALLGKAVGEVAYLKLPTMVRQLKVVDLRTIHDAPNGNR